MFYLARSFAWSSNGYYYPNEELRLYASMARCDQFFREMYDGWMAFITSHWYPNIQNMPTERELGEAAHFYSFELTFENREANSFHCWNTVHLVPDRLAPAFAAAGAADVLHDFYRNHPIYVKTNFTNVEVSYTPYPDAPRPEITWEPYDQCFALRLEK